MDGARFECLNPFLKECVTSMTPNSYTLFETPLGWCGLAWNEAFAVTGFQLPEATKAKTAARIEKKSSGIESPPPPAMAEIIAKVRKHFEGDPQDFRDIPIEIADAAPFAQKVYAAARQIPTGETITYGELAKALKKPNAARAVGNALGKNPIALIVPCHRVLAAGSKPGGFSAHGGLSTKAKMLALEGVAFGSPSTPHLLLWEES